MKPKIILLPPLLVLILSSCSSLWKPEEPKNPSAKLGAAKGPSKKMEEDGLNEPTEGALRFSENPNIGSFNDRRYRRVTRKSLEEESDVGSRAGSLWNTEGPSSYLFTQNKLHREGDLLNIKVEGNAKTQVDAKIQVIKNLLARLEIVPTQSESNGAPPVASANDDSRSPASTGSVVAGNDKAGTGAAGPSSGQSAQNKAQQSPGGSSTKSDEAEAPINIEAIPTRVTERMGDGSYRIKGQQSFMIGKKEFKVIVTGLVRPEDFSDEGISSNKLLDPQYDVVSLRRSLQ